MTVPLRIDSHRLCRSLILFLHTRRFRSWPRCSSRPRSDSEETHCQYYMLSVFYHYQRLKQVWRCSVHILLLNWFLRLYLACNSVLPGRSTEDDNRSTAGSPECSNNVRQVAWSTWSHHLDWLPIKQRLTYKPSLSMHLGDGGEGGGGGRGWVVLAYHHMGCKRRNTNASLTDRIRSAYSSPPIAGNVAASLLREHYVDGDVFVTKSVLSNVIQRVDLRCFQPVSEQFFSLNDCCTALS